MTKNYKIIVATHKQFTMPADTDLYLPIHVGSEGKEKLGYQCDNEGDNISSLNPYYCELTGLYWAWKNLECDYLGLVHYRRYFTAKRHSYGETIDMNDIILSKAELQDLLAESDVIVPKNGNTTLKRYTHTMHIRMMPII